MIISNVFYKVSILYEDEVDFILILFSMLILEMKPKVFLHEPHINKTKHQNSA